MPRAARTAHPSCLVRSRQSSTPVRQYIRRAGLRATAVIVLTACLFGTAGCQDAADLRGNAAASATRVGIVEVQQTGLLEVEELPADTFAFEIMPEADDNIAKMQIQYYGGPGRDFLGEIVLEPETGSYFTRDDTFRRGFTVADTALMENFTLSFVFVDGEGTETKAVNDYEVDAGYGVFYLVKITGSRDEGYVLTDH